MEAAVKIASDRKRLVVGLGETGWSVARFLHAQGMDFIMADSRDDSKTPPPYLSQMKNSMPDAELYLGNVPPSLMAAVDEVVLSPGMALSHPIAKLAHNMGKSIISDIELWRRSLRKPLIAVSGSNGKSTLVTLLDLMAKRQNINSALGGNLGTPVLDLNPNADLYIIEMSSYQLDITANLDASVACLLNVTPDHLERYGSFINYYQSKQRIFSGCKAVVYNKEDMLTRPMAAPAGKVLSFSGNQPDINEFGILQRKDGKYLAYGGNLLLPVAELNITGLHNYKNILAALAIAKLLDWSIDDCLKVATEFTGLPHRCEKVGEVNGVVYINDSKATNPEAACAALQSLAATTAGRIHIIIGGSHKGANFTQLAECIKNYKAVAYLIGEEAERLDNCLHANTQRIMCPGGLREALSIIKQKAQAGDLALLSPACASFDSYKNFVERGMDFASAVGELSGELSSSPEDSSKRDS